MPLDSPFDRLFPSGASRDSWSEEPAQIKPLQRSARTAYLRDRAREIRYYRGASGEFGRSENMTRARGEQMASIRHSGLGN